MSKEVCLYNKFGFCKYRESCRRHHYKENCEKERCQDKDICRKRHPKMCRKFLSENGCRFKSQCSYKHSEPSMSTAQKEKVDLKRRVELRETIVEEMAQIIIHLKTEMKKR